MALNSMIDWVNLFASDESGYIEGDVTLYIYGENDNSYIVIENRISDSPTSWDQYVFHFDEGTNQLFELFRFLNNFEFKFSLLVESILKYEYVSGDIGASYSVEGMTLVKRKITEN